MHIQTNIIFGTGGYRKLGYYLTKDSIIINTDIENKQIKKIILDIIIYSL
jgi:hypothetical protein